MTDTGRKPVLMLYVGTPRIAGKNDMFLKMFHDRFENDGVIVEYDFGDGPLNGQSARLLDGDWSALQLRALAAGRAIEAQAFALPLPVENRPKNRPWYRQRSRW